MILRNNRKRLALENYENNRNQTDPNKLINGRDEYSRFRFGLCTLDRVGCGVIAFYNILRLLKENIKFSELIFEMEINRMETIPYGFWGINPFRLKKMFSSYEICFERFFYPKHLTETREDGNIKKVLAAPIFTDISRRWGFLSACLCLRCLSSRDLLSLAAT